MFSSIVVSIFHSRFELHDQRRTIKRSVYKHSVYTFKIENFTFQLKRILHAYCFLTVYWWLLTSSLLFCFQQLLNNTVVCKICLVYCKLKCYINGTRTIPYQEWAQVLWPVTRFVVKQEGVSNVFLTIFWARSMKTWSEGSREAP